MFVSFIFLFVVLVFVFFHWVASLSEKLAEGLELSLEWKQCLVQSAEVPRLNSELLRSCEWTIVSIPIGANLVKENKSWRILKKEFDLPDDCKSNQTSCSFIIGRARSSFEVVLNGISIGNHLRFLRERKFFCVNRPV